MPENRTDQSNTDFNPQYETIKDLAKRTQLPLSWWYSQTRRKDADAVPRIKAGKYLRFVPAETDAWIRRQRG